MSPRGLEITMIRTDGDRPTRMPAVFLSHGAPWLADDDLWTTELAAWSDEIPRPSAILVVSAHWEAAPLAVGATETVPLYYDFYGFAPRYYEVEYPAPGAPGLAASVAKLLAGPGRSLHQDPSRGLDHGAYVPLAEMYPDADVPVLQISMPTLDPVELFRLGKQLAPLRDEGVLILGSGFSTHNIHEFSSNRPAHAPPPNWSVEFDDWLDRSVTSGDVDALLDFEHKAPAASTAHPRTEHFAPLFVAMGAAADSVADNHTTIDGFWFGMSKRSIQFN
jgi:4,5-DOPA dioxygenase extradiol